MTIQRWFFDLDMSQEFCECDMKKRATGSYVLYTDHLATMQREREAIRFAVALYVRSEGCECCRGSDHAAHKEALAKLLDIPKYDDGSGYDFYSVAALAAAKEIK